MPLGMGEAHHVAFTGGWNGWLIRDIAPRGLQDRFARKVLRLLLVKKQHWKPTELLFRLHLGNVAVAQRQSRSGQASFASQLAHRPNSNRDVVSHELEAWITAPLLTLLIPRTSAASIKDASTPVGKLASGNPTLSFETG